MQTSSTHLHSPQRERQAESPQTKCSVLVRCSGGWGIFQIDPCVNAIQLYLHRSASSLHHHFKGKPLLKVDGLGFMDYLYFSIWIYEVVLANLHGVYNRVWKQILCISMRGDLDYIIVVRRITLNTGGAIPWAGSCTTETGGKKLNPSIFSIHLLTRDADWSGPSGFHQQDFSTMVDCTLNYEQHSLFLHVTATRQGTESKLSPS